jgi:hypothetical protein
LGHYYWPDRKPVNERAEILFPGVNMPGIVLLDVIAPGMVLLSLGLGLVALFLFNLLITLVEGVVLTLLKWKPFVSSLLAALLMNTISSIVGIVLLIFLQDIPIAWIVIAFFLSIIIEGVILVLIQPATRWKAMLFALLANIASYLILILPAYLISLNR